MAGLERQKTVIVGGSSGVGLGVARAARAAGAEVVIAGRSADRLRDAAASLGSVTAIPVDMADEASVARLFAEVGGFDHLVITAGGPTPNFPAAEFDFAAAQGFVAEKLLGALLIVKHAVAGLRRGGSITFTSGIVKDKPAPGGSVVAAVAGAFTDLARALAIELAPTRVNVVSPGWVDTPMWDVLVGEAKHAMFADMGARLLAGSVPVPDDIAHAYLYLMQSAFTTGETLRVDGGQTMV